MWIHSNRNWNLAKNFALNHIFILSSLVKAQEKAQTIHQKELFQLIQSGYQHQQHLMWKTFIYRRFLFTEVSFPHLHPQENRNIEEAARCLVEHILTNEESSAMERERDSIVLSGDTNATKNHFNCSLCEKYWGLQRWAHHRSEEELLFGSLIWTELQITHK